MPDAIVPDSDGLPPSGVSSAFAINLDELDGKIHDGVDLVGYRLTGQVRQIHDLSSHNFISCIFDRVFANGIDLTRCDFKDVLVKDSHFRQCSIQASTHNTTYYINSIFEECDFTNGAHTGCEFREVRFQKCQLSNLLTKNSRLTECIFEYCTTETHIFEGNVFLRTRFVQTDLEVRAIASNFGIKQSLTEDCRIRSARMSEPHSFLTLEDLRRIAKERYTDPLALLSLLYFMNGNLLCGGEEVDNAFDMKNWLKLARQPASFAQLIELMAEFLVNAFEDDEVDIHKILLLHDVTRQIIAGSADDLAGSRLRLSFGGIHLALSRLVEDYLSALSETLERLPDRVRVLAIGPPEKTYYEAELADLLANCGVAIGAARPHNSPTEVEFLELLPGGRLFLIAALLASFVRVELRAHSTAIKARPAVAKAKKTKAVSKVLVKDVEFFELAVGMSAEKQRAYELRVKALLPTTSIIVDLKLSVSTQLIQKMRSVIIRILQD
jgi:uncharacterized protein YjbI with pentapeptide repeats